MLQLPVDISEKNKLKQLSVTVLRIILFCCSELVPRGISIFFLFFSRALKTVSKTIYSENIFGRVPVTECVHTCVPSITPAA